DHRDLHSFPTRRSSDLTGDYAVAVAPRLEAVEVPMIPPPDTRAERNAFVERILAPVFRPNRTHPVGRLRGAHDHHLLRNGAPDRVLSSGRFAARDGRAPRRTRHARCLAHVLDSLGGGD